MDKGQKFEYNQTIEKYIEENQVYELFEVLMKQLLVAKPERPLDFLIDRLSEEPVKRFFLMGPPGSFRAENAKALGEQFSWKEIHTGEILKQQVNAKTEVGKLIDQSFKSYQYVDDQIVIDLVQEQIEKAEQQGKSWIIQGYPRTKVQALALQKMGIIPDKMILLKVKQSASLARIKNNLIGINQSLYGPELEDLAAQCLQEYELNLKGVRMSFDQFIFEHDAQDKAQTDVANELKKMLSLRFKPNAPRRAPRVIILGPPGSGRDTQATLVSKQFGLVHVSTRQLLQQEINNNPRVGKIISQCNDNGELVPDAIVNRLIEQRLKQSDCKVNGWVMEGFPYTKSQVNLLKAMNIIPSAVFMFEGTEDESIRRLGNRRVDPNTGDVFNLEVNPPSDESTSARLVELPEDTREVVEKRFNHFKLQNIMLEESFREVCQNMNSEKTIEEMTDQIVDAIQNPL